MRWRSNEVLAIHNLIEATIEIEFSLKGDAGKKLISLFDHAHSDADNAAGTSWFCSRTATSGTAWVGSGICSIEASRDQTRVPKPKLTRAASARRNSVSRVRSSSIGIKYPCTAPSNTP